MRRRLVVNADDFGFTRDVNSGIIQSHQQGILTATTLMANGDAFDEAVLLSRLNPSLDIGCHLVLVQGRSLLTGEPLPSSPYELLTAIGRRRIRIYEELAAQVKKILSAGIAVTHLDTHKHTHLLPPVLTAVARIAKEFGIVWVRRPFDFPLTAGATGLPWKLRLLSGGFGLIRNRFERVLRESGCRTTDHFAGFKLTGRFQASELAALIRQLPPGTTEFMCHPGVCGDELRGARTRLKESRQRELEALISPEVREAVREGEIETVDYRRLSESGSMS